MIYFLVVGLAAAVAALLIKLYLLRRSANEAAEAFSDCLKNDTNNIISISSGDKYMCRLVSEINEGLQLLRSEHHRYVVGDRELKNAVTNISHDLRTPLTAICGYLDMLKDEEKSQDAQRYLEIISGRTEALKQLTEELFRYSVIMSSDSELKMEQVVLNDAIEESIAGFYSLLKEKKIEPEINMTEKKIIRMADRSALGRVFSNLINNAVKYSGGDLSVNLDDEGKIVFSNSAADLTCVEVDKLFDRFYTVEAARNSTGLGLSIARTLVEQMGGTITALFENKILSIIIKL
ncbi:MAG: HAMP domain-containing histidine kinase [Ruminococcus sp.]|uniref:sensor histidine kinase n=1 Tax=Ruminococcus sp. TaxID=41978 RepID=UPI0025ED2B28|nr:HAMP domain-containing sensor histidine kinase [Ruminococcus sp.]MCR5601107.1 HAMP domain-containing histidine kinase [Ruminococcus sp.]